MRLARALPVAANAGAVLFLASFAWKTADAIALGTWHGAEAAIGVNQVLMHGVMALAAWMCLRPRLSPAAALPLLAVGAWAYDTMLLLGRLHGIAEAWSLYPEFLRTAPGSGVNPQYAMMALSLGFTALLVALVANRSRRTFDRGVVLVAVLSVWATSFLFHATARHAIEVERLQEERIGAGALRGDLSDAECRAVGLQCDDFELGSVPDISSRPIAEEAGRLARRAASSGGGIVVGAGAANPPDPAARNFAIAVEVEGTRARVAASMERTSESHDLGRWEFMFEAGAAHLVWLSMAFLTAWYHNRLPSFRRRAAAGARASGSAGR